VTSEGSIEVICMQPNLCFWSTLLI